jgi:hypothetical protein
MLIHQYAHDTGEGTVVDTVGESPDRETTDVAANLGVPLGRTCDNIYRTINLMEEWQPGLAEAIGLAPPPRQGGRLFQRLPCRVHRLLMRNAVH